MLAFFSTILEIKLQKGVDNILPPLVVPTCRYWQCAECVENAVTPDYSNQERDAHKQFDALHSDVLIQNFGNLCTEQLGKEEHISDYIKTSVLEAKTHSILEYGKADEKKAECHVSEDIGSGKASFVCSKNTFHSGDGGAEETKTLQLTGNEIFISLNADALHQSHSDCKTVFNNAASSPTDSELIPQDVGMFVRTVMPLLMKLLVRGQQRRLRYFHMLLLQWILWKNIEQSTGLIMRMRMTETQKLRGSTS